MHAYDLGKLKGGLEARLATAGEKITLLDGKEIKLTTDVLVIADADGPVGMAGVMGGAAHARARADTVDVLFEAAFFTPAAIAGRGRRYGLVTDAGQRFERGVDPAAPGARGGARHAAAAGDRRRQGRSRARRAGRGRSCRSALEVALRRERIAQPARHAASPTTT